LFLILFKEVKGETLFHQDKFRLDLSEEEAVQYMQNLIDVSATAIMAAMVERLHSLAQYWRK
jgi:phosphatidylinositol 3-kinase